MHRYTWLCSLQSTVFHIQVVYQFRQKREMLLKGREEEKEGWRQLCVFFLTTTHKQVLQIQTTRCVCLLTNFPFLSCLDMFSAIGFLSLASLWCLFLFQSGTSFQHSSRERSHWSAYRGLCVIKLELISCQNTDTHTQQPREYSQIEFVSVGRILFWVRSRSQASSYENRNNTLDDLGYIKKKKAQTQRLWKALL